MILWQISKIDLKSKANKSWYFLISAQIFDWKLDNQERN